MRYKFFIGLFALFGLSNAVYTGGTMRWKQIDSSTVRIEARIFESTSDCSTYYGFPQEISFGYIPVLHSTNTVGSASAAVISNTTAYKCFDVFYRDGEYAETRFFTFHVDVSSLSSPFYLWMNSTINMFTKITLGHRTFFNGRSTNTYNESPAAGFFPYLKVQENESIDYNLAVFDPNFDKVKCRLATDAEYGTSFIGNTYDYFQSNNVTVNENCTITFPAQPAGSYAIAIMLEDYQYSNEGSLQPLSLVPVQFLLSVATSGASSFSQQSDVCRNNSFISDNKYETQYGISTYTEIPISPSDPGLTHIETFSTLHTVVNGSLRQDGSSVVHFDGSLVWLIDSNFTYSSVEVICYAGTTNKSIHKSMQCFFLSSIDSNLIDVTIGLPSKNSVQSINGVNTFQVYFHAAVSEFTGTGYFQVYRTSDNGFVTGITVDGSCTTTDCQFVPDKNGLNITLPNTYVNGQTYYVNYSLPVLKYCQSPAPLSDPASWTFTTKIFKQTAISYTQEMKLYTDTVFDTEVTYPFVAKLGDYINVGINIAGESGTNALIYRCYATETADPNDVDYYEIISNGCKQDSLVNTISTSYPNLRFSFAAFRFTNSDSSDVYLHCQTKICMPGTDSSLCTPNCGARKRRYVDDSELTYLRVGPIFLKDDKKNGKANSQIDRAMSGKRHNNKDSAPQNKGISYITQATQRWILIVYGSVLGTIAFVYFLYRHYWHHYCI